jgi:Domain of unknown function (DUF4157)
MGFDREKRLAGDPKRRGLDDDLDRRPVDEHRGIPPGKRTLVEQQLTAGYAEDIGSQLAVGHRTLLDRESQPHAPEPHAAIVEPVVSPWSGPWSAFDDFRSRAVHEVLAAVSSLPGGRGLVEAAAARATQVLTARPAPPDPAGLTLWRVAERRAATLYRHAVENGELEAHNPAVELALARGGGGQPLPEAVRRKLEAELGTSFERVRIHTDSVAADAVRAVRARAFTVGEDIFFAEGAYAPDTPDGERLLAHELTHVVQAYQGRTRAGGAGIEVSSPGEALEREAEEVAARLGIQRAALQASPRPAPAISTPALPTLYLARNPPKSPNAPAPRAHAVDSWAGAGKSGKLFQHAATEAFVDRGTRDSLEIRTRWTLAEFRSYELGTDAVMEVRRTIRVQLARGASILVESRARSWFHADQLPNDVHAALHAPAKRITHDGSIVVTDDRGLHLLRTHPHPLGRAPSLASMLAGEPMLGFATPPEQRLREASHFVAHTVPRYDENMLSIESIMRDAPAAALGLRAHIKAKLGYESPPQDALTVARHTIARLEAVISHAATGYEGTALLMQLSELHRHLAELLRAAEQARPADKALWGHALDGVQAIGKTVVGLGVAVKEIAFMARDLGMWGLDAIAGALGSNLDWTAASSIGKAYQAGKSTGEIFTALVDGVIDQWGKAIEHAGNGDLSLLMDLGAELALDLAIEVATAGAATPGVAARRAGRVLELTHDAAAALARRADDVAAKTRAAIERAPAAARQALLDSLDVATGLADGLRHALQQATPGVGPKLAVLDPGAIPRAIQHVRGARAIGDAKAAISRLRGPAARAQGHGVIAALEQLAKKAGMPDAIHAIARRIADGGDAAGFVARLHDALGTWGRQLDDEVLAGVLRRAADAVDPASFLGNVDWVMHRRIKLEARKQLVRQAVNRADPLDLRWLQVLTDLPDEMLEFMALDPSTNWKAFMKVSDRPSDYFPSSLKKQLTKADYADAGAKLRGVAGELIFVIEDLELPGGLKIVGRQVDAGVKKIDFQLENAASRRAKLEVKSWNEKSWKRELDANYNKRQLQGMTRRMVEQLQAAKQTGEAVYLAVSDAIGAERKRLKDLLEHHGLEEVNVITFPEGKLRDASARLRKGLGMGAAGLALVTADDLAEHTDE